MNIKKIVKTTRFEFIIKSLIICALRIKNGGL